MKRNYTNLFNLISSVIIFFSAGCHRDGFLVSESGLHYDIFESYDKKKPKVGDMMEMHLVYKTSRDSVLFDSNVMGKQLSIELQNPSFRGGLEEAFAMLGEGDSAAFLIRADSLYEKVFNAARPVYIRKGENLRFDVRMIKISSGNKQPGGHFLYRWRLFRSNPTPLKSLFSPNSSHPTPHIS